MRPWTQLLAHFHEISVGLGLGPVKEIHAPTPLRLAAMETLVPLRQSSRAQIATQLYSYCRAPAAEQLHVVSFVG